MNEIIESWQSRDGTRLEMRQMPPSDAPQVKASLNKLSADARRRRFFAAIAEFSDDAVHRLIDIDPAREYLLVVLRHEEGAEIPIAGGRFVHESERPDCTFSLLIGDPWQGQCIGRRILKALIREAARRGLRRMHGHVLADNRPMLGLARAQRFTVLESDQGDHVLEVVRELSDRASRPWKVLLENSGDDRRSPGLAAPYGRKRLR
ncbi:MAG: GNAT family N-acetyltransferase [Candidatus Accumulibacter phosphatis]|uniref:GNAT family N-acetyltransferase n=1 Tax=Candidatus Accumulibacter sp. ACC012 TaxID=2823332 RepID=UPI0025C214FA|nr:GNAT family N-acetyltransferase [Candidatus Accumulibacter sp. ACC012]